MSRVLRDFIKFISITRQSGLRYAGNFTMHALRDRLMRSADRKWEAKLDLDFGENRNLDSLHITSENKHCGFSYAPSTGQSVRVLLANLPNDLRQFSFIDFGSGEGRALLAASAFPFREIVGIEFAEELHNVAVRNIEKAFPTAAQGGIIRSLYLDATQFKIPRSESVLYFFNPFNDSVFKIVLKQIEDACVECGKKYYILYQRARGGLETSRSENISLLRASPHFCEREIRFPTVWSRFLLGSVELYIFESREYSAKSSPCGVVKQAVVDSGLDHHS